jgi:hypothetical protein
MQAAETQALFFVSNLRNRAVVLRAQNSQKTASLTGMHSEVPKGWCIEKTLGVIGLSGSIE